MRFIWDERKNRKNRQKHRISFETAALVFADPHQVSRFDREAAGEVRWHTIGMAGGVHVVLVVHTTELEDEEEIIRIISARKATPQERQIYGQGE